MDRQIFLSICITSYNRISELERCLKSIDINERFINDIEIVIGEDCSPKKDEIKRTVNNFINHSEYHIRFYSNAINLGYDCNLGNLIKLARGKYILFISDDDSFIPGALNEILKTLFIDVIYVAFTPFMLTERNTLKRYYSKSFKIPPTLKTTNKYLFDSILFSGLIFNKEIIKDVLPDRFKNLMYFQVYLFAYVILHYGGHYISLPLINCHGDGENAFGLSESSIKNELLANRKSVFSNLEYHKGLISTILIFETDFRCNLISSFSKEYSLRSFTGLYNARMSSKDDLIKYWRKMNNLQLNISSISSCYYLTLLAFGPYISSLIFSFPKHIINFLRKWL